MVALEAVRASNLKLQSLPNTLVALFVGATSGIGESTLKTFFQRTARPRVYFVGRNAEAGKRILSELKVLQPNGEANFIQKDLSLLKNVDEVCEEVKAKEKKLNLLFMTSGILSMKGRNETSEGLDSKMTTNYYARMRFTHQLLPLLQAAAPELSRVVSVLAPGEERASFNMDDLDLKQNFSLASAANHCITMTDFTFEHLARECSTVSFVHAFPGYVKTGFSKEAGMLVRSGLWMVSQILRPIFTSIEESGERHLYIATSRAYPANSGMEMGVELGAETVKKGSTGVIGGAYLIGADCEVRANEKVLAELRQKGAGQKIWDHLMSTFRMVRG